MKLLANNEEVLMTGVFPNKDGGVIIYNGAEKSSWFGPAQDEQVSLVLKKVWVAKGSFCELK